MFLEATWITLWNGAGEFGPLKLKAFLSANSKSGEISDEGDWEVCVSARRQNLFEP